MPCRPRKCQCGRTYFPQRYVMTTLMCLAMIVIVVHMLIFILVLGHMVAFENTPGAVCNADGTPIEDGTSERNESSESSNSTSGGYYVGSIRAWDYFSRDVVIAAFFVGYVTMLLPCGYIADVAGARMLVITAVAISSLFTILMPLIVEHTFFWLVCLARILIGAANAAVIVSCAALIARWIPRYEWCTICGAVFSSTALGMLFGGYINIPARDDIGWECVHYIWGALGFVWVILAFIFLYSDHDNHPAMTNRERGYLDEDARRRSSITLKWLHIFLDKSVWGLIAAQVGHSYLVFFLGTNMPYYFMAVLNVAIADHWACIILPYVFVFVIAVIFGVLADNMIHTQGMRPILVKKIYYLLATLIPAIFVITIPFMECETLTVCLLTAFGVLLFSLFYVAIRSNTLDITYNYPGFLTGCVLFCGAFGSAFIGFLTSLIIANNKFSEWRIIAIIVIIMAIINLILYIVLGSAKRRLWDLTPEEREYYRNLRKQEEDAYRRELDRRDEEE